MDHFLVITVDQIFMVRWIRYSLTFGGNSITVTNATDIEHIIQNLNAVNLKKEKISMGYMGYSYRTTVYKVNGDVYREFIINSSDTIRRDPFFYRDSSGSIDYKFIQELFNKNIK